MAKAFDKEKLKPKGATQTLCDYVRLIKVWFDDQKVKKTKADRKLKVSTLSFLPGPVCGHMLPRTHIANYIDI